MFSLSETPIDAAALRAELEHVQAGACVVFEGWVRDHSQGRAVHRLSYQAYPALALREGQRIMDEVCARHPLYRARCVHRVGELSLGEMAVWVGVCSAHRDAAFVACREIIDRIKQDVAIWKNEHYRDGDSGWIHHA